MSDAKQGRLAELRQKIILSAWSSDSSDEAYRRMNYRSI